MSEILDIGGDALVPARPAPGGVVAYDLAARVRRILEEGTPDNTQRAYAADLRYIEAWCAASGLPADLPMSRETVVRFLVDHVDGNMPPVVEHALVGAKVKAGYGLLSISTVSRRFMALSSAHRLAGVDNPCLDKRVREILTRARKRAFRSGWAPRKKAAAHLEVLEPILATCGDDLRGLRDRALLLFAFSSGGRRASEVSGAEVERLERVGDDYVYQLGLTKTDKEGEAGPVPVAGPAAEAMQAWLQASRLREGALFRYIDRWGHLGDDPLSPKGVRFVVKARAAAAGLDPRRFGAHSLRSGFMTESGFQGINVAEAMALSRHRSVDVAAGYHQAGEGLRNRAARLFGAKGLAR